MWHPLLAENITSSKLSSSAAAPVLPPLAVLEIVCAACLSCREGQTFSHQTPNLLMWVYPLQTYSISALYGALHILGIQAWAPVHYKVGTDSSPLEDQRSSQPAGLLSALLKCTLTGWNAACCRIELTFSSICMALNHSHSNLFLRNTFAASVLSALGII